jgi:hypothetical protein
LQEAELQYYPSIVLSHDLHYPPKQVFEEHSLPELHIDYEHKLEVPVISQRAHIPLEHVLRIH